MSVELRNKAVLYEELVGHGLYQHNCRRGIIVVRAGCPVVVRFFNVIVLNQFKINNFLFHLF